MAVEFLSELKYNFPSVFVEPKYPVERSDASGIDFKHYIRLKDEGADPPKRRLYPLDE